MLVFPTLPRAIVPEGAFCSPTTLDVAAGDAAIHRAVTEGFLKPSDIADAALDLRTGEVVWSRTYDVSRVFGGWADSHSLLIGFGKEKVSGMMAIDARGEPRWQVVGAGVDSYPAPIAAVDDMVVVKWATRRRPKPDTDAGVIEEYAIEQMMKQVGGLADSAWETSVVLLARSNGQIVGRPYSTAGQQWLDAVAFRGAVYVHPTRGGIGLESWTWQKQRMWAVEDRFLTDGGMIDIHPANDRVYVLTESGLLCLEES